MTDGHVWQTLQVHIGAICSHLSCNCRYPAKAMIKKVKSLIYYTLVYQPAAHFWTATRSQKRGFFTPTEVGAHLPTPEGWRAELAQEGRLHQTVWQSVQSQSCLKFGKLNARCQDRTQVGAMASAINNCQWHKRATDWAKSRPDSKQVHRQLPVAER